MHILTNFIYLGFLLLLHSSFPEPFAEPNPKCMKSVHLGPSGVTLTSFQLFSESIQPFAHL